MGCSFEGWNVRFRRIVQAFGRKSHWRSQWHPRLRAALKDVLCYGIKKMKL
jgi:hypothetical protein